MEANNQTTLLPPPRGSSIEPPKWLLAAVLMLLAARIFLALNQPALPIAVHFYSREEASALSKAQNKPILYVVSAHWSIPCRTMEKTALSNNQQVIDYINTNFLPVLIYDQESKNNTQTREFFKRYDVNNVPAFIATLHDGMTIKSASSYSSAHELLCNLQAFVTDTDYAKGKDYLRQGNFAKAQERFALYLERTHWSSLRSGWASIFDVITLRILGNSADADQALKEATKHERALEYSSKSILDYLSGQTSEEQLLNRVYRQGDSVSYHFAVGMNAFALKDFARAKEHLQWVVDNSDKNSTHKLIAASLLQRISKASAGRSE